MAEKKVPELDISGTDAHILISAEQIKADPKRLAKAMAQVKLYAEQYGKLAQTAAMISASKWSKLTGEGEKPHKGGKKGAKK